MGPKDIIVGLDIGTTKVCAIVAQVDQEDCVEIIGLGTHPSVGLRKGIVVNIEETVRSIQHAIEKAERMAGIKIEETYVGIAGGHIFSTNNRGVVAVANEDKEITADDIERVIQAAQVIPIPSEKKLIHLIPSEFIIDGYEGIKDPEGMSGSRLEVKAHLVMGSFTAIQNLTKSVEQTGIDIDGLVLEPIASAKAVLTPDEQELGAILIDIGGGTTDVAIFEHGGIRETFILPVGGNHVTNDIAMGLRTPIPQAEDIKLMHGCALEKLADESKYIELPDVGGCGAHQVPQAILYRVIESRMSEIFTMVNEKINELGRSELLPGGIVLTGGASLLPGIQVLAEREFNFPVRIGYPENLGGLTDMVRSPIYATGVGLLLFGLEEIHKTENRRFNNDHVMTDFIERIKDFFGSLF